LNLKFWFSLSFPVFETKEFIYFISILGKIVLVFEVVPIEWKWREIQSYGGVAGVTFSRPGKYHSF
jgi:hypothetical protein